MCVGAAHASHKNLDEHFTCTRFRNGQLGENEMTGTVIDDGFHYFHLSLFSDRLDGQTEHITDDAQAPRDVTDGLHGVV